MRRSLYLVPLFLILLAAAFWWTRPRPILTIVTWSGTYGRAQAAAQILPYGQAKRVDARIAQWDGKLDDLRQWLKSGQHGGDVVDMELPAAVAACREGLLEPVDAASLPPGDDGTPASKDFLPGTIGRCFVASAIYSQALVCHCDLGTLPQIFDAVAQGKKLALQRGAKINLEMALLADGVKPDAVYAALATEAGVARAFARLDTVKRNIVWWSGADEAATLLRTGRADIATMLTAQVEASTPSLTVSSMQFTEADVLGVPKGDPKKDRAMDYIRFATASQPLANMVRFAPYTPPRRSSLPLVEKLPASPMRDFVLSQGGTMANSFAIDDVWWATHGAALEARFRAWVNAP